MGITIAFSLFVFWFAHLFFLLFGLDVGGLFNAAGTVLAKFWIVTRVIFHTALQGYLYTGLFITAHDAMHGTVSKNRRLNRYIGTLAAFLFAAFWYKKLHKNHMKHHRWPGEERDPDFYVKSQRFFVWFGVFFSRYVTVWQILIMAGVFNLLIRVADTSQVVLFWVIPAFLGTLQLFYFGTYKPHMYPHLDEMGPHHARTQDRNHLWAMLSCYFFGYHVEHHDQPGLPWWKLYRTKNSSTAEKA